LSNARAKKYLEGKRDGSGEIGKGIFNKIPRTTVTGIRQANSARKGEGVKGAPKQWRRYYKLTTRKKR